MPGNPPDPAHLVPPGAAEGPANGARRPVPVKSKTRSGIDPDDVVEPFTDEDWARATGLLQILDEDGRADPARIPQLSPAELARIFRGMILSRQLDTRLLPMQRQGRIGFYIGSTGQEAGVIGGAHALLPEDYFVPGLRETGAGLYRGLPLRAHLAQIFGNANDLTRGRQLPCHSGSRASHHIVMSSCVSSQIPHATGIAMAAKIRKDRAVALCYLGDGGTSEEDFHVGLNFAGVYQVPAVFVCQNNQWAISTPLPLQTASETIAVKGLAYGIPSVRIDGNDIFAVYATIKEAVERARQGGGPTFIEALTYRLGPHSSSDDPTRYRDEKEPAAWRKKDPLARFGTWLAASGVLSSEEQTALTEDVDREIREAIALEEQAPMPEMRSLIEDVYAEPTWLLEEQLAEYERVRKR
jgi:pyruvate dehydrogenase E1 component alpha subunit/2-oxoisovalerate dehydrogenase E1 component alpha subunit